ncbi:Cdc6/Cdc18 family protein [Halomicroarcula sp. GCM10025709]|uniref:Cdc6/Cdc18 family protein n=1 Tax=Haloarcula TaxID=2237 RepID=UPI0024C20E02|nr:AAA family ATPase [Halomicroarcula sp. YJ-61-S]
MIADRSVFGDDHPPQELLHREPAVAALTRAFEPATHGDRADDVLIAGPSGVGKTVLATHTLGRLQQRADIHTAYVRALDQSAAGIVRNVLQELGADPAMNTPLEDLCLALDERVDRPTVVVLDEASELPRSDALARLDDVPLCSWVAICHEPTDWLARVDDRVRHRVVGREVVLDRYSVDELADILEPRVRQGLRGDPVGRDQLERIADTVAGVARAGIQTLLAAAEIADERQHSRIRDADIEDGWPRAQAWIRESNLESLPFHHQLLYELIRRDGPLRGGALHRRYDEIADDAYAGRARTPVQRRARRDQLAKLREYDLIECEGSGRGAEYRVCDASIRSPYEVAVPPGQ